jgi:hypothetical protein
MAGFSRVSLTDLVWNYAGRTDFAALPAGLLNIWVVNTYTAKPQGTLAEFTNTYRQAVPGPLPLLGAGVAFGFSRKLRRRINGVRRLARG